MFTGATDVKMFLTKCELHCKLKGYEDEKIAVFIAERLDEAAFDTYMTLTTEDKKDPEKIKDALLNGFDRSKRNREVAVEKLKDRGRLPNEGAEVFAYKIKELVKSAYPKFNDDALALLTKDYYVKGLHIDIQKELRKHEAYEDKSVDDLVTQTILLEIAGKNSSRTPEETIGSVKEWTSLECKVWTACYLQVCEQIHSTRRQPGRKSILLTLECEFSPIFTGVKGVYLTRASTTGYQRTFRDGHFRNVQLYTMWSWNM